MNLPHLSICIPTFNRSKFLEIQLERILQQIKEGDFEDRIELVVSNNASNDLTDDTIKKYLNNILQFNYIKQTQNIGLYNIIEVTKYATGKFVWIVSDDDIIVEGALAFLIDVISKENDLKMITGSVIGQKNFPNFSTSDKNCSLKILGSNVTYLSFCVFKNSKRLYGIPKDSLIPHSFIFLDVISQNGKHLFSSKPLLTYRPNNETSYSLFKAFYSDIYVLYLYALEIGFDKKVLDNIISKITAGILFRLDVIYGSKIKISDKELTSHFFINKNEILNILKLNFPGSFYVEKKILRAAIEFPTVFLLVMQPFKFVVKTRRTFLNFFKK